MSMQCCVTAWCPQNFAFFPFFFFFSHQRLREENRAKPKEAVSPPCRKVWHKRRRALLSAVRPPRGTRFSNGCTQIESGLGRQALCCFWFQDSALVLLLTVLCRHSKGEYKGSGRIRTCLNQSKHTNNKLFIVCEEENVPDFNFNPFLTFIFPHYMQNIHML